MRSSNLSKIFIFYASLALAGFGCHPFQDTADHPFVGQTGDTQPLDPDVLTDDATSDADNPDATSNDAQDTHATDTDTNTTDTDTIDPPVGDALYVWSGRAGAGEGSGTPEDPFQSLDLALRLASQRLATDPSTQRLIYLADGDYTIPPDLFGSLASPTAINFTGIHFFGGFAVSEDNTSVLWASAPADDARSRIELQFSTQPMTYAPRSGLSSDFEGTFASHITFAPNSAALTEPPEGDRALIHVQDTSIKLSHSSIEVPPAFGFSIGLLVDSSDGRRGLAVVEDSEIVFPRTFSAIESKDLQWLIGAKTHGGILRFTRSKVLLEQPRSGALSSSFDGVVGVYAAEPSSRIELLQTRVNTGFARSSTFGVHCENGCTLLASNSSIQSFGIGPENKTAEDGVGVSLLMAKFASIDNSRINVPDTGGLPTCMAQHCTGFLAWGSYELPPLNILDSGPQPNTVGPISNCDKNFYNVIIEGSRIGGANNGLSGTGLNIITNEEGQGGAPPLACINASRIDAGRCGLDAGDDINDAHCRGVILTYPLATVIHNSIIYGGEALTKSAALEISVGGLYRYVVLASNVLHGGSAQHNSSTAILLNPSIPGVFDDNQRLTSGVIIVGNDIYSGDSPVEPAGVEEVPSFLEEFKPLVPLALMSNNFHNSGAGSLGVLYKQGTKNLVSIDEMEETLSAAQCESFLNLSRTCSLFSPADLRANPNYIPEIADSGCVNAGLPYDAICLGESPPNGVIGWLPWGDIAYRPRVCNILACNVATPDVCIDRWSGDNRPDIGPAELPGAECACAQ